MNITVPTRGLRWLALAGATAAVALTPASALATSHPAMKHHSKHHAMKHHAMKHHAMKH